MLYILVDEAMENKGLKKSDELIKDHPIFYKE